MSDMYKKAYLDPFTIISSIVSFAGSVTLILKIDNITCWDLLLGSSCRIHTILSMQKKWMMYLFKFR